MWIKHDEITDRDMIVVGHDRHGLPVFTGKVEAYVSELLNARRGELHALQEQLVEIWVETRKAKIKSGYDLHGNDVAPGGKSCRHVILGWSDSSLSLQQIDRIYRLDFAGQSAMNIANELGVDLDLVRSVLGRRA
jgi:hypothetical protein